jgi:hypothetical protein
VERRRQRQMCIRDRGTIDEILAVLRSEFE